MAARINTIMNTSALVFGVVLATTSAAMADTTEIPNMEISLSVGGSTSTFNPASYGSAWQNSNNTFGYAGSKSVDNSYGLGWSMLVNPDPFVIANIVVTNNTLATQTFSLTVSLPTVLLSNACIGGSVTGSVTDLNGNGATFASVTNDAVYTALIDGAPVQQLLTDPFSVTTGNFLSKAIGPASFGTPIPSMPWAPGVTTSIGITLKFTLTAGDSASLTSIFAVEECIPAPAGLALLGFAGLLGGSRRRRA